MQNAVLGLTNSAGRCGGAWPLCVTCFAIASFAANAGPHADKLERDIRVARDLAEAGDYKRSVSAFELLLLLHSAPADRARDQREELLPICDALVAAVPYDVLTEPVEGVTNCPGVTLEPWFENTPDAVPVVASFGQLQSPEIGADLPGYVDFVFDVNADGVPENIEIVFRSDKAYLDAAVTWFETLRYEPGRFAGAVATYKSVRIRAEFVAE